MCEMAMPFYHPSFQSKTENEDDQNQNNYFSHEHLCDKYIDHLAASQSATGNGKTSINTCTQRKQVIIGFSMVH